MAKKTKPKKQASKTKPKAKVAAKVKPTLKAKPKTAKPKRAVAKAAGAKAAMPAPNATGKAPLKLVKKASFSFTPLDDRILVEKLGESDRTPGGLYIPDTAKERPTKGRVVAVGRGHSDKKGRVRPLEVKVGDSVLFTQWSGNEIDVDGTKFLIMRESDLLGISTAD